MEQTTASPFNLSIAVLDDYLDSSLYPASLQVAQGSSLYSALTEQSLAPEDHLLGVTWNGRLHVIPMRVVLCYNVIEGVGLDGDPWVMTFCNACNTGMLFDARVDGQTLHFQRRGAYEGMLMIWDAETGSYWQHITGECLYGPSAGKKLQGKTVTRHLTAAEALVYDPETILWTTDLTPEQQKLSRSMEKMRARPELVEAGILSSVQTDDQRRPRFELGLLVWSGSERSFYPLESLGNSDNKALVSFAGRTLLVYHAPGAISPSALFVEAKSAAWNRDVLVLDNGWQIEGGALYDADRQPQRMERPMQLLMRWFGAAAAFPNCHVWQPLV